MKTYIVPLVHTIEFGFEAEVEARSLAEAKHKAKAGDYDQPDGYDWNRADHIKTRIGKWQPVEERGDK